MGRTTFRRAAAVLAAVLLVGACGGDDDTSATAGDTAGEETTSSTSEAPSTGSGDQQTSSTTVAEVTTTLPEGVDELIEVTVAGGEVQNGGRHDVAVGDTVAIVVTSDVVDEVHVHGYDVYGDIGPGEPSTITVDASIPGVWEVELHDSGLVLLQLAVS